MISTDTATDSDNENLSAIPIIAVSAIPIPMNDTDTYHNLLLIFYFSWALLNIEQIYKKYNTILPSSGGPERVFSRGKLTFACKRHRLSDENFE